MVRLSVDMVKNDSKDYSPGSDDSDVVLSREQHAPEVAALCCADRVLVPIHFDLSILKKNQV